MKKHILLCAIACAGAWAVVCTLPSISAQTGFPDPNAGLAPETAGKVSPLIPMQSTEAVHMGLV